jgi:RNA polymerase sigma-70 factor (ECF subfamily)
MKHTQNAARSISLSPFEDPTLERTLSLELQEMVSQALERLPSSQRHVLQQVYFQGETQRAIATQMNRPLGTIKSLIRYGLKNMKKHLQQWEETGAEGGKSNE